MNWAWCIEKSRLTSSGRSVGKSQHPELLLWSWACFLSEGVIWNAGLQDIWSHIQTCFGSAKQLSQLPEAASLDGSLPLRSIVMEANWLDILRMARIGEGGRVLRGFSEPQTPCHTRWALDWVSLLPLPLLPACLFSLWPSVASHPTWAKTERCLFLWIQSLHPEQYGYEIILIVYSNV